MAARGIRDSRMAGGVGHPIQISKPPSMGRPVMTKQQMVRPVKPANLREPKLGVRSPLVSTAATMPPSVAGPEPVNPSGPMNVQPINP
jgi:hypothetical protein